MNRRPYETPAHLYPMALVADETGGDETPPDFVLPADLTSAEVTDANLGELEAQAVAAVDDISAREDITAADLATISGLADAIEAIRGEAERRITEAAQVAADVAAQVARVHGEAGDETATGEDGAGEGEGGDGAGEGEGAGEGADTGAQAVAAASTPRGPLRINLNRVRSVAERTDTDRAGRTVITAAADVAGFQAGQVIADPLALGQAASARAAALRSEGSSAIIASIALHADTTIEGEQSIEAIGEAFDRLTNAEARTAMVAAGGWCAPSERLYDFVSLEAAAGLVNLPTANITRGGVDWPVSPTIADVLSAPWEWTEAQDITALDPEDESFATKPCFRIPCGTFASARLGGHGICVTTGNLSERAWPEQNRRYMELVLAAHAHIMNKSRIDRMIAGAHAVTIANFAGTGDANDATAAAAPVLDAIELQVQDMRDKFRMDPNATLEAVFPVWILGLIRTDLTRRNGGDISQAMAVTDAQITAWMRLRGIVPQFVQDYQPLQTMGSGVDGYRELWPTSVSFLLYPAGTYVLGQGGNIDLGAVRDSSLNAVNDHIAAWTEEFDLIAKKGPEARSVTLNVGRSGAAYLL